MKSDQVLLLALPRQLAFCQGVIRGVHRYLEENQLPWLVDSTNWSELQSPQLHESLANRLLCKSPEVVGLIGHIHQHTICQALKNLTFPVVNHGHFT